MTLEEAYQKTEELQIRTYEKLIELVKEHNHKGALSLYTAAEKLEGTAKMLRNKLRRAKPKAIYFNAQLKELQQASILALFEKTEQTLRS